MWNGITYRPQKPPALPALNNDSGAFDRSNLGPVLKHTMEDFDKRGKRRKRHKRQLASDLDSTDEGRRNDIIDAKV